MRACRHKEDLTKCPDACVENGACSHYKDGDGADDLRKAYCELAPEEDEKDVSPVPKKRTDWCHLAKLDSVMSLTYDEVTPGAVSFEVYRVETLETDANGNKQARIAPEARPEMYGLLTFGGDMEIHMSCRSGRVNKLLAIPAALRQIATNMGFPLDDGGKKEEAENGAPRQ